jgi:hypothetical protein
MRIAQDSPFASPLAGTIVEFDDGSIREVITCHRLDVDWRKPDDPRGKVRTCTKKTWIEKCSRYHAKLIRNGRGS